MSLELILPRQEEPRFHCLICGSRMFVRAAYDAHLAKCAREHEGEIERYRALKRDNVLVKSVDPELSDYYKRMRRNQPNAT